MLAKNGNIWPLPVKIGKPGQNWVNSRRTTTYASHNSSSGRATHKHIEQMPVKNGNSDVDSTEFDQYLKDNNCMCTTSASHTTLQVGDLKMID